MVRVTKWVWVRVNRAYSIVVVTIRTFIHRVGVTTESEALCSQSGLSILFISTPRAAATALFRVYISVLSSEEILLSPQPAIIIIILYYAQSSTITIKHSDEIKILLY